MSTAESCVLAVDLGGTSLRAGRVDAAGQVQDLAARPHRIAEEADPWDWWHALTEILAEVSPEGVQGIAISGFTRSQVLADAAGNPVRPAQCFPDGRAGAEAEGIAPHVGASWVEANAYHPLARMLWVRRHDPAAWARARTLLQPKDWLSLRLTGAAASDRTGNAWLWRRDGTSLRPALAVLGLDGVEVPEPLAPTDRIGAVTAPQLPALRGVPVFAGAMDTWCALLGAGALRPGGSIVSGTTDACGVLRSDPAVVPGLVTVPWGEGLFYLGGPSQAGADCAAWAAAMLGVDVADLGALAERGRPGRALFLPYLTGERAPLWQPGARGTFLGLERADGAPEIARAVLEGVALANRDLLERAGLPAAAPDATPNAAPVRIAGGGARSDAWCRIRADMLGRPLLRARATEPGLVGAAAIAWVGLGRHPSLDAAQMAMAADGDRFDPDPPPAARARADAKLRHFRAAQAACVPLAAALVADPALG